MNQFVTVGIPESVRQSNIDIFPNLALEQFSVNLNLDKMRMFKYHYLINSGNWKINYMISSSYLQIIYFHLISSI